MKSPQYYAKRVAEIGISGALQNLFLGLRFKFTVAWQSFWWGRLARREMADTELLSHTIGQWRSVGDLLEHLAARQASSYLLPHDSQPETVALLRGRYPQYVNKVISSAEAICRNEIHLLGHVYSYPGGVDWHREPVSGLRWPLWHRSRIGQYLYSPKRPADLIVYWELNRHQFFITLGIAYWLTNDQKYVDTFISLVRNWISTNPLQHGLNWYYPLEVAIRLISWTVAFQFFRGSSVFREELGAEFLKSLWQQADFLNGHLQTSRTRNDVPNNHLMAELTGLILVGSAFPEFQHARTWCEKGLSKISEQAQVQTHSDGVHKEQAIGYHRFVMELLLLVYIRNQRETSQSKPALKTVLNRMFDYLLYSMTPDGTVPTWGDSDYGKALGMGLDKDFWDVRPLLSLGAILFERPDLKFAAGALDVEAFWLLGTNSLGSWHAMESSAPQQPSQGFSKGGVYIIRDDWKADTDVAYFRSGPFGLGGAGYCAHAHCDLLSVILWVEGQPLLVDSGTYAYSGSWRQHFRLTKSHNTVLIDGHEQGDPKHYFGWKRVSDAECTHWSEKNVSGTLSQTNNVKWIRDLSHSAPGDWEINDKFAGSKNGDHRLEWFFHFAPDIELRSHDEKIEVFKDGRHFGNISIPCDGLKVEVRNSWFSYDYGVKVQNQEMYAVWEGRLTEAETMFKWHFQFDAEVPDTTRG